MSSRGAKMALSVITSRSIALIALLAATPPLPKPIKWLPVTSVGDNANTIEPARSNEDYFVMNKNSQIDQRPPAWQTALSAAF